MSANLSPLNISVSAANGGAIRLLQITDCHLGEQEGEQLVGMDTDKSLDYVVALLAQEQADASLLLATGDLSNHGTSAAYQRLEQKLSTLPMPKAWLAGNHDSRDLMVDAVGEARLPHAITIGNWLLVMLDSTVPGKVGGTMGEQELALAQQILSDNSQAEHVMVCLHHQPVSIGCEWLDQQRVTDSDALINLLSTEPRLRAVIWGHVHQAFSGSDPRLPGVALMSAPSTCIQFAPASEDFKIDSLAPGYRWFDLHSDGRIETGVSRVQDGLLDVDLDSSGY